MTEGTFEMKSNEPVYPPEARRYIHREAIVLAVALIVFLILGVIALCFADLEG